MSAAGREITRSHARQMVAIREAKRVALKAGKPSVQLICEASGGYEQPLLESLAEQEVAVTLVQAVRVRQYARAAVRHADDAGGDGQRGGEVAAGHW